MAKLQQVGTTRPKARRPPGARRSANDQLRQELTDALQRHAAIAEELERVQAALKGSLEQQTATSEILKIIANSQSDVQPVFDAIASSAKKLIGAHSTTVFRFVDGLAHLGAFTPTTPEADAVLQSVLSTPVATAEPFTRAHHGLPTQFPDTENLR